MFFNNYGIFFSSFFRYYKLHVFAIMFYINICWCSFAQENCPNFFEVVLQYLQIIIFLQNINQNINSISNIKIWIIPIYYWHKIKIILILINQSENFQEWIKFEGTWNSIKIKFVIKEISNHLNIFMQKILKFIQR